MKKTFRVNLFLVGIPAAALLAWAMPEAGAAGGILHSEWTTRLGIVLIFFNQGLVLPSENLRKDLFEWRLHLFVQGMCFGVIPLATVALLPLLGNGLHPDLRVGFLYLAMLPTTIATANIYAAMAGGNLAGAIFNTSLSNILGVFIVPVWGAWLLSTATGETLPVLPLLAKIAGLILLPLAVGQCLRIRARVRIWATAHKRQLGRANTGIILFILYAALSNSFLSGVWSGGGLKTLVAAMTGAVVMIVGVRLLVVTGIRLARLSPPSGTTAYFCASQKTLAAGLPMAESIFGPTSGLNATGPDIGLVVLPLIGYHFLQLLADGIIAARREASM